MPSVILNILYVGFAVYGYRKIMTSLEEKYMSTQDAINAVVAQLSKALGEITGKLEAATSSVQSQLVDAGVQDAVDLSALFAIAQQLDDLVPDVAVDEAEVEGVVQDLTGIDLASAQDIVAEVEEAGVEVDDVEVDDVEG